LFFSLTTLLESFEEKSVALDPKQEDPLIEGIKDCLTFALKVDYILQLCDVPEPPPEDVCTALGIWAILDLQKCFCVITTGVLGVGKPADCYPDP